MRTALRVLSIANILLSGVTIGLFTRNGGLSYMDPSFGLALLVGCGGYFVALAAFIVALVAASAQREFRWMTGVIVIGVFALLSPMAAILVVSVLHTSLEPTCLQTLQYPPQCTSALWQTLVLNSPTILALVGPLLVGLVALAYSFGMRTAPSLTMQA